MLWSKLPMLRKATTPGQIKGMGTLHLRVRLLQSVSWNPVDHWRESEAIPALVRLHKLEKQPLQ
jgi:hypothetical protein